VADATEDHPDIPHSLDQPSTADGPAAPRPRDATPSVLAVIVAHNPGEWFEESLDSFATQDYPRLSVMVIDNASDSGLAARVSASIPRATVLDASDTEGFGAAANAVLDTEPESAFLLLCHDDVSLAPDVVRVMVAESLRSNAGVLGPKLVEFNRPNRLQHVGLEVDRFGVSADVIEPAELDQEQFDYVADFSAVPTACMLVRTDLFSQLEGFDPVVNFRGDDVDFCWRAHLAGARVMVAPDARVRHIEDLQSRTGVDDVRRTRARHQLRSVLTTSSVPSLAVTLPLQLLLSFGEAFLAIVTGSFSQVTDVASSYTWNLRRFGDVSRRRKSLRPDRRLHFVDLRQTQHRGSVRISAFVRGQIGRNRGGVGAASRGLSASMRSGTARVAWLVLLGVLAFVLFGSRALITDGIPIAGDFNAFPAHAGDMLSQWWNGWHDRDLGSPGTIPSGVAIMAVLAWLLGDSVGLIRTLWVLAPLLFGLAGVWHMLKSTGSRRAQTASMLAFIVVPLPWAALGAGSVAAIYAYAASPWLIHGLLKAENSGPFASTGSDNRSIIGPAFGASVAVGLAAVFEPNVVVIVPIVALGLILGGLLSAHPAGVSRIGVATGVIAGISAVMSLPLVLDLVFAAPTWDIIADGHTGAATSLGISRILRFGVGPSDPSQLIWFLAVPMALPLLIGRSWRFDLAVKAWMICLLGWGLTLLASTGVLPFGLPDAALLLAAPAMAVVLLMGVAVASAEHDLRTAGFGWRQLLAPVAVASAALAVLPSVGLTQTGRWGLGKGDFRNSVSLQSARTDGSYRILWIGAPENLPVSGRPLLDRMAWAVTLDGLPTIADRFVPADDGSADLVEATVDRAIEGATARLGRDLGGLGIRYVVMVERLQPAPYSADDTAVRIPAALVEALAGQLDLARVEGTNSSIRVFENSEWRSVRSVAVPGFDKGVNSLFDLEQMALPSSVGVLAGTGTSISGPVPADTEVFLAQSPNSDWHLNIDGVSAPRRTDFGWASAFSPADGGTGSLQYSTPLWRRLALLAQLVIFGWLMVVGIRRVVGSGAVS